MTMLFACSKGCGKKEEKKVVVAPPKLYFQKKEEKKVEVHRPSSSPSHSYSGGGSSSVGDGRPPDLLTEEEKEKKRKKREEERKKIANLKKEMMKKMLEDPNISPDDYEKLKLRSNPSFLKGMAAMENGDYDTSIVSFNEILKDKDATPVSKYFACTELMVVARRKHDFDLYFIAARMRANLIANEDLSVLDFEKDNKAVERINKIESLLKAKNDPKYFDLVVETRLARVSNLPDGEEGKPTREQVVERVKKDIEYYSGIFKELVE